MKRPLFLALPLALVAISGCGSSDAAPKVDKSDLPGSALACLESKDIPARQTGENGNELVLDAEQIGTALLFVPPETSEKEDDLLHDVEICLADL